jgi:hypothetical protein
MPIVSIGFTKVSNVANCPELLQRLGPTIGVCIGFDPAYDDNDQNASPAIPIDQRLALVDTGTSHNAIDAKLAQQLSLPIVEKRPVSGVLGSQEVEFCRAQIYLPQFNFSVSGTFPVIELHAGGERHDALLGRGFLRHFVLQYDGVEGSVRLMR